MLNFKLRPVIELINARYKFFVPRYQRGYKWTREEVLKLMTDIWDFHSDPKSTFYCLQPVVVRPVNNEDGKTVYHVIDGQQRLTTLLIIQKAALDFTYPGFSDLIKLQPDDTIRQSLIKKYSISDKTYSISYDTREDSSVWLPIISDAEKMQENSDYYHINQAYNAAVEFFHWIDASEPDYELDGRKCTNQRSHAVSQFSSAMEDRCDVIWYELNNSNQEDEDIFDNLNTGQIPLTNAELIKALLLQKSNFPYINDVDKKVQSEDYRTSIAREWDIYEHRLENPTFWYFIYDENTSHIHYDTRMEYIFDLLSKKTIKDSDSYHFTFDYFDDLYQKAKEECREKKENGKEAEPPIAFVQEQWGRVKNLMDTLKDWYENKTYYHLIGYLICQGHSVNEIMDLQFPHDENGKELPVPSKNDFINSLKEMIRKQINSYSIGDLYKGRRGLTPTLLLFNILIDESSPNDNARFPFHHYKQIPWNEEHVAPNTPFEPNKPSRCLLFSAQMLEYFTGISYYDEYETIYNRESSKPIEERKKPTAISSEAIVKIKESLEEAIDNIEDINNKSLCKDLLQIFIKRGKDMEDMAQNCYERIQKMFETSKHTLESGEMRDFIWNQVLLDEGTNKSYGNAIFPYKRMRVIKNDSIGIYVPQGTKNVFLKAYSHQMNNMLEWDQDDAMPYLAKILTTLKEYDFLNENWLDEDKKPEFVDENKFKKLKAIVSYEQSGK